MKREVNELAWRTKLITGLTLMGAFLGALGWAGHLAEWPDWTLPQWFRWFFMLVEKGFGGELAIAAGVGLLAFAGPALWLLLRRRGRGGPPRPDAGRKPLKPL